ncbi:MAG: hypothetical protein FWH37_10020 [Candidatus Bathyarchaeota archaeon]|nr:hypothetical protein [Candidatus Termiticorpusculum sp.]
MSFNGGVITNPIEIRRNFITFSNGQAVRNWMYDDNSAGALDVPTPGIGLRFVEPPGTYGPYNDLFSAKVGSTPAIAINYHLWVRKDFMARGMIDSREGILVLHGNGQNATKPPGPGMQGNDRWNIGWGPRAGGAPFIWLAEGGDRLVDHGIGGNPAAETLLIVTNNDKNIQPAPPEIPGYHVDELLPTGKYRWGHLECGNVTTHGHILLGDSGNDTTDATGTKTITFASPFPSNHLPRIVCTAFDPSGRSITAVVTARTYTNFTVKTFLTNSGVHNHKVGDARASTSNPLSINNAGSHSHSQINYSSTSQNAPATGYTTAGGTSHNHTTTMYPAASTNSAGDHNHSLTKPTYARELAMRKQDGSTYPVGVTMTTSNEPLTEMWTHDNSSSTTNTPISAQFSWIAM